MLHDTKFLGETQRELILDRQRDVVSAVTRFLRRAYPERVGAANQTAVAMMLFGMINWTFTWLRPGGALSYAGFAEEVVTDAGQGPVRVTALHIVVMGVAGCGKSAAGAGIARQLGLPLIEGDGFHPDSNVEKMRHGRRRSPTRTAPAGCCCWASSSSATPGGAVLTCSALKAAYRDVLRRGQPGLRFVHLALTQEQALQRVAARSAHFYPPSLVASQFEALQDPSDEPGVLVIPATLPLEQVVARGPNLEQNGAPVRGRARQLVDLHSFRHIERLDGARTLAKQIFRVLQPFRGRFDLLGELSVLTALRCSATWPA